MNIQNEILNFDEANGTILVRYFTDEYMEGLVYNIDLPIIDGQFPDGIILEEILKQYEPKGQLERIISIKTASVPNDLKSKIVLQNVQTINKAEEIRMARNELLVLSDYTQLADVNLTEQEKLAWKIYRQALRDITKQNGFPDNVLFPSSPSQEPR